MLILPIYSQLPADLQASRGAACSPSRFAGIGRAHCSVPGCPALLCSVLYALQPPWLSGAGRSSGVCAVSRL